MSSPVHDSATPPPPPSPSPPPQASETAPPRASGFTESTDVPLYWCAYGQTDGEQLIFLHGGPGAHHDYLLPQMLTLGDQFDLLFYDQRGGGRSRTDARSTVSWHTQVSDLGAVISERGRGPLTLVGYSWGGLLALLYTLEAAHSTDGTLLPPSRLILIDPAPASRAWRTTFEAEFSRRQRSDDVRALRDELAASGLNERDPDSYRQRAFELGVAGYFAHPAAARALTPFRVIDRVQRSIWASLGDFDLVPSLRSVTVPALVVHGREDPVPLESSTAIAQALGAPLIVLDDCGHVPYVEQPVALFRALRSFLADTSAARAG